MPANVPRRGQAVPQPALAAGICVGHEHSAWWTSDDLAERQAAARLCQDCVVIAGCAAWAISQPVTPGGAVLGGMTACQQQYARNAMLKASREAWRLEELRSRSARAAQQAAKQVCDSGHDLTDPANVRLDKRGWRVCLPCKRRTRNASERLRK